MCTFDRVHFFVVAKKRLKSFSEATKNESGAYFDKPVSAQFSSLAKLGRYGLIQNTLQVEVPKFDVSFKQSSQIIFVEVVWKLPKYDSGVVIYDCRVFIRLSPDLNPVI